MLGSLYTYLLVDIGCIIVPLIASFHPSIRFYRQWKFYLLPCLAIALFFIIWDIGFTYLGIWHFNSKYVLGYYLINLPIEEVMFFIFIPYACTFTYFCCSQFIRKRSVWSHSKLLNIAVLMFLLTVAVLHPFKLYTSVTFLLLSLLLSVLLRYKADYLAVFFISYLLILLPFFIANGILTGSFINEPVVIYNNAQNLNMRIFTIPVEDFFYGMLLMLMNVAGYEYAKRGARRRIAR